MIWSYNLQMVIKCVHLNFVSILLQEDDFDPTPSKREDKQGVSSFALCFCGCLIKSSI